ncbi:MAG: hypothetical protein QXQ84_05685 [Nitrososphaerota archaeon]
MNPTSIAVDVGNGKHALLTLGLNNRLTVSQQAILLARTSGSIFHSFSRTY